LIRYNLTSRIIRQIRLPKSGKLKYCYEVNFKSTTQIVQEQCRRALDYNKILEQISHYAHPLRGNRLLLKLIPLIILRGNERLNGISELNFGRKNIATRHDADLKFGSYLF